MTYRTFRYMMRFARGELTPATLYAELDECFPPATAAPENVLARQWAQMLKVRYGLPKLPLMPFYDVHCQTVHCCRPMPRPC